MLPGTWSPQIKRRSGSPTGRDWQGHDDQTTYRTKLKNRHGRKWAFRRRVSEAEARG